MSLASPILPMPRAPASNQLDLHWDTLAQSAISGKKYHICSQDIENQVLTKNHSARIPQILKNYREKSCEGLALLFFMLSMVGNLTYGISLVAYSQDKDYLLNALPWLIGSLGTIAEDLIIFAQFRLYATRESAIGA